MNSRDLATLVKTATCFTTIVSAVTFIEKRKSLSSEAKWALGVGAGYLIGTAILGTDSQKIADEGLWPAVIRTNYGRFNG